MRKLSTKELEHFNGGSAAILIDEAIARCYHDLQDRPHLKKPRKVTVEIILKPKEATDAGDLKTVETDITVKCTVPPKQSRQNLLTASRKLSGLGFEPDTANAKFDHRQETLPDIDGDESAEKSELDEV